MLEQTVKHLQQIRRGRDRSLLAALFVLLVALFSVVGAAHSHPVQHQNALDHCSLCMTLAQIQAMWVVLMFFLLAPPQGRAQRATCRGTRVLRKVWRTWRVRPPPVLATL